MKIAYCDCFSGISGDMFLGALLDAGLPLAVLEEELAKLNLPEHYHLHLEKVQQGALFASSFSVHGETNEIDPDSGQAHSHPHPHGHAHEHEHDHEHGHEHAHDHEHDHEHNHEHDHEHGHEHSHRSYRAIAEMIETSGQKDAVKHTALQIFHTLAESEAKMHGTTMDEVHFHEVGALDSIIDIIGAAIGLDHLGIERLYSSSLPYGEGQVHTQHGILPIPAPATLDLLTRAGAPLRPTSAQKELVTPTGAAILAALATFERPAMHLSAVGVGAGKRQLPWANIFRLIIGETEPAAPAELVVMETNIDDMNPQIFGVLMEKLFTAGALDVFSTPIQMKKNRPAVQFSIIAKRQDEHHLAEIMLRESTTFGLRVYPIYRYEAERSFTTVQTPYGAVTVKVKHLNSGNVYAAPEFDEVQRIAKEQGVPFLDVWQAALNAASA
ncbi:MAG: nickel pincer cofactor biosynthesis protein LarC [Anaerolineae bacterium]|nr:nickel pincer cofactor biosynthesis protein LarC [Anaerolineae bacterium]